MLVAGATWVHMVCTWHGDMRQVPVLLVDLKHLAYGGGMLTPGLTDLLGSRYPPLPYLWTSPFYAILGYEPAVAFLSISVLAALLAPATYLVGRAVGGPAAGAAAFLLTAGSVVNLSHSARYEGEPLVALLTALFLAGWFATRNLTRPGPVLLCGVLAGLGMLAKHTFLIYTAVVWVQGGWFLVRSLRRGDLRSLPVLALVPCLAAAFLSWSELTGPHGTRNLLVGELAVGAWLLLAALRARRRPEETSPLLLPSLAALLLALAVAGPWYLGSSASVVDMAEGYQRWEQSNPESMSGAVVFSENAKMLEILVPGGMWLLPLGIAGTILLRGERRHRGALLVGQMVVSYLGLTALGVTETRFFLPVVPVQAALGSTPAGLLGPVALLAPALLLYLLWQPANLERWAEVRLAKEPGLPAVIFTPPLPPAMDALMADMDGLLPDRSRGGVSILCRTASDHEAAMRAMGFTAQGVDFLFVRHGLATGLRLELEQPARMRQAVRQPGTTPLVLTATRTLAEERALVRQGERILDVRFEREAGAVVPEGRLTLWRAKRRTASRSRRT